MSFDLYAESESCSHCGHEGESCNIANVTHNVNEMVEEMFKACGVNSVSRVAGDVGYPERSWGRWNGWPMAEVAPIAEKCLAWLNENEVSLKHLNPENGWGSTRCLARVLGALLEASRRYPSRKLRTWG